MASRIGKAASLGLSGAASGAALGSAVPVVGTTIGAGAGGLAGILSGLFSGDDDELLNRHLEDQKQERERSRKAQMDLVDQMHAPEFVPQYEARIKALEDDARPGSLSEDRHFQGQRSRLVHSAQGELADIQNKQRGYGVTGGFSNIGSISDVYDRLSGQLAELAERSAARKDRSSQMAAEMAQRRQDALTEFENARIRARMAIESGDAMAISEALRQAFEARQRLQQGDSAMMASTFGGVSQLAGGMNAERERKAARKEELDAQREQLDAWKEVAMAMSGQGSPGTAVPTEQGRSSRQFFAQPFQFPTWAAMKGGY